ncbi:MAG: extracellular solute-binding protein, partial [Spirochaetales bacterium]|nr:extracellular solute-binding protein [Spirochaetales bacterium]
DLLIVPNDADATMSARAAQGKLPDILQMQSYSRVAEYAAKGYLVDLTKQPVLTKVVDSSKPAVTWNSKLWGLPMDFAGIGIIYNKDIFAKYGLKPPATYRDLERLCRTLRTNGVTPFAGLLKENWSMGHFITLVHTNLLAEKNISADKFVADMNAGKTSYGVVDTDKLFSVMDFYRANMDKNAEEWNWNEQQAAFAEGKAAMMVQGLWSYGAAIGTNPKLDCGFVPFPIYNDAGMNKFYADVDSCFGVSAQSAPDKKAAALKFLEWLATSQAQKIWVEDYKLTLSFKGADVSKLGGPFVDLMSGVGKNGAYPWAFASYPTAVFEDACKNGAQQYVFNKKTAEAVIADIDKQWAANVKK